jgi:O-6-methylguanine DNA methyltransferase
MKSPVGTVYVAMDGKKVVALTFGATTEDAFREEVASRTSRPLSRANNVVRHVLDELREYFMGDRQQFSFVPDLSGCTAFQQRVLAAAARIPYGQTRTYGWLARNVRNPAAARAVGQAMARNPVPIIVPCHRVIGSDGGLCGFGGGERRLDLKRTLLEIEGVET